MTAQLNPRGDVAVLVPAAGAGVRLGPGGPKALRLLDGEPLLVHAVRRVAAAASVRMIVVAAPPDEVDSVRSLLAPVATVTVVAGGAERQQSVAAALAAVPEEIGIVLVHDAARALTPASLVESVAAAVRGGLPAVIPVLPVIDTIKEVGPTEVGPVEVGPAEAGPVEVGPAEARPVAVKEVRAAEVVLGTVDRSVLRSVQTPQGFRHEILAAAHRAGLDPHTDDAGMVEKAGVPVTCVPGSELAMKITRPLDLILAEALLRVA